MHEIDYLRVFREVRLANGSVWGIPITLPVTNEEACQLTIGETVALRGKDGQIYGILELEEKYRYDKELEARLVYGTTDINHPGVSKLYRQGNMYLAGPITLLNRPSHREFQDYYKDPVETRRLFSQVGWDKIVGFQTRNPIHRA